MGYAAHRSPSSRADRKRQRREGLRSEAVWRDPLRRACRAIDSANRRIESSGRVIDATLRFSPGRPLERVRQLDHLCVGIDDAELWLRKAQYRVDEAVRLIARSPEQENAFALLFIETAVRFAETVVRLDQLSNRAVDASEQVLEETLAFAAASTEAGQSTAAPAQAPRKTSPRYPHFVLVIAPRLPAACATVADAARKISRGRAPPLSPTARSIH